MRIRLVQSYLFTAPSGRISNISIACKLMNVRKRARKTPIGVYRMMNNTHNPLGNLQQQRTQ